MDPDILGQLYNRDTDMKLLNPDTVTSRLNIDPNCPKCGNEWTVDSAMKHIRCFNTNCELYDKTYLIPSITLIEKMDA